MMWWKRFLRWWPMALVLLVLSVIVGRRIGPSDEELDAMDQLDQEKERRRQAELRAREEAADHEAERKKADIDRGGAAGFWDRAFGRLRSGGDGK